ncbi:hypothetical protein D3C78_1075780 [compost metagenome]
MKSAAISEPSTFNTYHELPPRLEACTELVAANLGIGTILHLPDWEASAFTEGVIQLPVGIVATSPLLKAATNWLQSAFTFTIFASIISLYSSSDSFRAALPARSGVFPSSFIYQELAD